MAPPVFPGDADEAASSYLHLSRIALLMEEQEADDVAELSPDHPALLHAQLPFSQILSGAPFSPDQDPVFPGHRGSPNGGGHDKEYGTDMFTAAFFRGVDEATKFLPADTADEPLRSKESAGDRGRRDRHSSGGGEQEAEAGRASKLATAESEEASAREMFDEMMLRGFDACAKGMGGLTISMENVPTADNKKARKRTRTRGKRRASKVVDLHTLLLHCAKAVIDNRRSADELLKQIKDHASPTGDATQRLAYCFAQGLEARLAGTGSQVYRSLTADRTPLLEFLKAYQLFMSTCCFRKVAFHFANKAIFDVAIGRSKLHIVD
ncbi:hypothetical protein PVAP13_8NG296200 [Panicum virgatum]|uniref:Uncharacterized protein n=1 Tax=Panicum virgatum TaxID=38727 RepID=A0A8T0PEU9_PANVG|nr:hypothetical protein PVAP13_8NG296200 [Panicum virgatum]